MARPELFRTLLDEARVSESAAPTTTTPSATTARSKVLAGARAAAAPMSTRATSSSPTATSAPAMSAPPPSAAEQRLERRLDQALLAGVTPPRGMRKPSVPLRLEPLPPPPKPTVLVERRLEQRPLGVLADRRAPSVEQLLERRSAPRSDLAASSKSAATSSLMDELEAFNAEATRQLERPAAIDAALQDAVAAAEATREIPAQRRMPARPVTVTGVKRPPPSELADVTTTVPRLALMPEVEAERERTRPPPRPLQPRKVATSSLPPVLTIPTPKVMQVLGDELTIPGMSPLSSTSGKVISQADLYRLQLEFEDTPARPLPALASLLPLPVQMPLAPTPAPVLVDELLLDEVQLDEHGFAGPDHFNQGFSSGRLGGIESTDLNRLEELEGIEDLDALAQAMGLKSYNEVSIPDGIPEGELVDPPRLTSDIRRARVHAALGDGAEHVFDDKTDPNGFPTVSRPPLPARPAKPVIVKIPARPKVSLEARNQARKLYLAAVDELAKGDKAGAVGHLKLAIHYDDGVPLYADFLKHLTKDDPANVTNPRFRRRRLSQTGSQEVSSPTARS